MPAIVVLVIGLTVFALGYWFYGSYLARRVYAVDDRRPTPAHTMADGLDFVATNKQVLFGHHFTSVAGAAPIVGPAIAVFWGWGPAVLWVLLGTVFAAGVHDFGSLMVSVRHRAQNIGTLTKSIINARSRTLFLFIIFFLLTLVNAVFAVVIGNLLVSNPAAAIPVLVQIPLAIAIGQYVYRTRSTALVPTLVGVVVLYLLIPVGVALPISLDGVAGAMGMDPGTLWILLLFAYAFVASRLPVWVLLQPRDYINSHQLFIALGVIFLGMAVGFDRVVAPVVATDLPDDTPSFFPFLFVTIACGAISGFHSLVASGTTSKQLDKESDATYVGYAGAVGEGSLALGAILATTAGITAVGLDFGTQYADYQTASDGAVGNFVDGVAGFASNLGIPVGAGATFAAIVVISFAATTMDTGVRLQRYIIQELGELVPPRRGGVAGLFRRGTQNLTTVTVMAVAAPLALALAPGGDGDGFAFGRLWTLFGTTNQLTAGLALAVIAVWVTRHGRSAVAQIVPLVFLLVMTTWALVVNLAGFVAEGDWILAPLDAVILGLAGWLVVEAVLGIRRARRGGQRPTDDDPGSAVDAGGGSASGRRVL